MKENNKESVYIEGECTISKETKTSFKNILKRGVYKELNKQGLISDVQLNSLLNNK